MNNQLTDLLTLLMRCSSYEECWKVFYSDMQSLGFVHGQYCYAMNRRGGEKGDKPTFLAVSNYSDSFMADYLDCKGEKYDYSVDWCLQQDNVLKWDSKKRYSSLSPEAQIVENMSYDHQILNGLSIPLKENGSDNWGGIGLSATAIDDKEFDRDIYPHLEYIHQAALLFHTVAQKFSKYDLFVKSEQYGLPILKPIEKETLKCLSGGLFLQDIAQRFHKSPDTVNGYIRDIKKKLKARTSCQAVAIAVVLGIV